MSKYLYGASVQGIQDFIFKTNKLKEIIGASEIVKSFDDLDLEVQFNLSQKPTIFLQAAGNIRCEFSNTEDLEKVALKFPKYVMQKAYGITISQAVVKYDENENDFNNVVSKLIEKIKIQRNKASIPLDMHFSILEQSPRTGRSSKLLNKDEINQKNEEREKKKDIGTVQKIKAFEKLANKDYKNQIFDIEKISNDNNKIAVIHADGNGLGNIVKDKKKDELVSFSEDLKRNTKDSFDIALKEIKSKKYRKIILGGDDLTFICDASYALEFTQKFMEEFEKQTGLTACAGVAFCNEKYPMHYALNLAEDLCSEAKTHTKKVFKKEKVPPSCLMFHNIQSSAVKDFDKFIEDELTIKDKRLDFAPYYLNAKEQPKIDDFLETVKEFQKENSPKGKLREWLNDLEYDETYALNQLKRIEEMNKISGWKSENLSNLNKDLNLTNLFVQKDGYKKSPIYDILQIVAIKGEDK